MNPTSRLCLALALLATPARAEDALTGDVLWTADHAPGANAVAHAGQTVYVASGTKLHALDLESGQPQAQLTVGPACGGILPAAITSLAAHGDRLAVAVANAAHTKPGWVLLYDAQAVASGDDGCLAAITVGALPDMLTFTPDGARILVANEGEPDSNYLVDPEGSISVIDVATHGVLTAGFTAFNGQKEELVGAGVRIFGPNGATVAQDLEPEHIAVSASRKLAWVTLQENNAVAVLDLPDAPGRPTISAIRPLGFKDYGREANALDVSDRDGVAGNLHSYPNLFGMYQPDGIVAGDINGKTYFFTANEGDAREYLGAPGFIEEVRVASLTLDSVSFPGEAPSALQRLRVTTTRGHGGDGDYEELYAFGARSFAVWRPDGQLVYDSGNSMEALLATPKLAHHFASCRSDDKGPEPEELVLGDVAGRPYLFVGLERADGVMAFDVRDSTHPRFAGFLANPPGLTALCPPDPPINTYTYDGERPERLAFVPARVGPAGEPLLLVTNEVSGKTRAFKLRAGS